MPQRSSFQCLAFATSAVALPPSLIPRLPGCGRRRERCRRRCCLIAHSTPPLYWWSRDAHGSHARALSPLLCSWQLAPQSSRSTPGYLLGHLAVLPMSPRLVRQPSDPSVSSPRPGSSPCRHPGRVPPSSQLIVGSRTLKRRNFPMPAAEHAAAMTPVGPAKQMRPVPGGATAATRATRLRPQPGFSVTSDRGPLSHPSGLRSDHAGGSSVSGGGSRT